MERNQGATMTALAIGAVSAMLIGIPIAALIWFFVGLAVGERFDLAVFSAYFVLTWGLH